MRADAPLASIHVRREALTIRVEVRDLPPLALSQQGGEAGGSLTREAPGRAGAAPTKPGRGSTARWRGSGERDEEEYARNQRYTSLKGLPAQIWRIRAGSGAHPFPRCGGGELLGGLMDVCREATVKCCGVAVARPQGQSWAPPSSSGSQ